MTRIEELCAIVRKNNDKTVYALQELIEHYKGVLLNVYVNYAEKICYDFEALQKDFLRYLMYGNSCSEEIRPHDLSNFAQNGTPNSYLKTAFKNFLQDLLRQEKGKDPIEQNNDENLDSELLAEQNTTKSRSSYQMTNRHCLAILLALDTFYRQYDGKDTLILCRKLFETMFAVDKRRQTENLQHSNQMLEDQEVAAHLHITYDNYRRKKTDTFKRYSKMIEECMQEIELLDESTVSDKVCRLLNGSFENLANTIYDEYYLGSQNMINMDLRIAQASSNRGNSGYLIIMTSDSIKGRVKLTENEVCQLQNLDIDTLFQYLTQ